MVYLKKLIVHVCAPTPQCVGYCAALLIHMSCNDDTIVCSGSEQNYDETCIDATAQIGLGKVRRLCPEGIEHHRGTRVCLG
jgi:hypothetical protein